MVNQSSLDRKRRVDYVPILVLVAATLICLLPFIGKAFNIDDPLFVWAARHIRTSPLDPYGFKVNWYATESRMSEVTMNPPLACYYIALASYVVGWGEVGLHLAFLIPALAVVLGTYALARRLCDSPVLAALGVLFTPVFLISSTTVMCDTMMLALWVWATVLWMRGLDNDKHHTLALSALLTSACVLTKYYGLTLVPLLLAYSLMRKRRLGWWGVYLVIPVAVIGAYQLATKALYGHGLLLDAAGYAVKMGGANGPRFTYRLLTGLAFTGGCLAPVLFYAPKLWSRRVLLVGVALATAVMVLLWNLGAMPGPRYEEAGELNWSLIVQLGIWTVAGLSVLALSISDFLRHRDADALLLCLWVVATFVFTAFCNWTVNARSIFPAAPALGILLVRRMRLSGGLAAADFRSAAWPLVPAVLLALWVTSADCVQANSARMAAESVCPKYRKLTPALWFEGHWGFQYYMEPLGAKPVDTVRSSLRRGDMIVVPEGNANKFNLPPQAITKLETMEFPGGSGVTTTNPKMGAGFYSSIVGPLPFVVGSMPPERYRAFLIVEPIDFHPMPSK